MQSQKYDASWPFRVLDDVGSEFQAMSWLASEDWSLTGRKEEN
jgi:hypothetical protein